MKTFDQGKQYRFSKEQYLVEPMNSAYYKTSKAKRVIVDECDGQDVNLYKCPYRNKMVGYVGGVEVDPASCVERSQEQHIRALAQRALVHIYKAAERELPVQK